MKKIFNFRPLFYCFIAFFSAILFAQYLFKTDWIYLSLFIFLVFGLLVLSIIRNKIKIYLCILLFFSLGLLGYCVEASTYNVENYTGNVEITGIVTNNNIEDYQQRIVLNEVSFNGEQINENIYLIIYGAPYLNKGDVIEFTSDIETISAYYNNSFSSFYYKNNIRYFSDISGANIQITGTNDFLSDTIKSAVKEKLQQNMTSDNAALAYSMLFGDKSDVDINTIEDYRGSGIAHILSISGLHIGIIVGFLYWILKKIKCPKIALFLIIIGILLFYCYLCGFSPSVTRASIMSVCLLGGIFLGRKNDFLSSIGLAGLIILLITPFSAYDIGFQLSFGCVIGIAMFYRPIYNFFLKIKIPKFIVSPLTLSITAQFFILPILINAFGGASIFSIFLNVLIIPIFSIAYIIIFISTPLLFTSGFFGNFLWLSSLLLQVINVCANFVANISWSIIPKIEQSFIFMLAFYSVVFIFSQYIFLNYKTKIAICVSIIGISAILTTISQNI
ncbi:MAG: ComEC/Rec2 family competence protein [Clostridia bacterium]|nr:ComEC/Rec2 family competence protein [Clostridia bacterium]